MPKDQFGTELQVGDTIIFVRSNARGNTMLTKDVIVSFSDSGRPRVMEKKFDYEAFRNTGERQYLDVEVALKGNVAKGYPNEINN